MSQEELWTRQELLEAEIIPQEVANELKDEKSLAVYTGERLKVKKPELYKCVLNFIAEGHSFSDIAKIVGVSFKTVAAIADNEPLKIQEIKNRLAKQMTTNASIAQQKLREMLANFSTSKPKASEIYQIAMVSGMTAEKANLMRGDATSITEEVSAPRPNANWKSWEKNVKDANFEIVKE